MIVLVRLLLRIVHLLLGLQMVLAARRQRLLLIREHLQVAYALVLDCHLRALVGHFLVLEAVQLFVHRCVNSCLLHGLLVLPLVR